MPRIFSYSSPAGPYATLLIKIQLEILYVLSDNSARRRYSLHVFFLISRRAFFIFLALLFFPMRVRGVVPHAAPALALTGFHEHSKPDENQNKRPKNISSQRDYAQDIK